MLNDNHDIRYFGKELIIVMHYHNSISFDVHVFPNFEINFVKIIELGRFYDHKN